MQYEKKIIKSKACYKGLGAVFTLAAMLYSVSMMFPAIVDGQIPVDLIRKLTVVSILGVPGIIFLTLSGTIDISVLWTIDLNKKKEYGNIYYFFKGWLFCIIGVIGFLTVFCGYLFSPNGTIGMSIVCIILIAAILIFIRGIAILTSPFCEN